jgi:rhomboid protease GluP
MAADRPTIHHSTEGLSRPEVIVLLFQAFRSLKWGVEHLHPMRVVAKTPATGFAKGEDVVIEFDDRGFTALSKPSEWSPFAKNKRHQVNLEKLIDAFAEARVSTTPEVMAAELKELEESGVMQLDASTSHANEFHWKDIGSVLIPRRDFFATPLLLDISVLVYIGMVATGIHFMSPTGEDLLNWGGNYRAVTMSGEWWRLLTCCFVHIGVIHLLFNMYALLMVGLQLEPLLGSTRVIALYVITGMFASVASLWWHDNTVSAGASGAIFGLYGVFLALLTTDLLHKEVRQQLLSSIGVFVVYNLIYGLKGGVDNAAHIGGLLSGVVMGFALYPALRKPEASGLQWVSMAAPTVLLVLAGGWAVGSLPADDHVFEARMADFTRMEEEGLAMFRLGDEGTAEQQLVLLDERSAPAWDSAVALLEGTLTLELSSEVAYRRDRLLDYARERSLSTGLIRQSLTTPSVELDSAVQQSFARIDSMFTEMQ